MTDDEPSGDAVPARTDPTDGTSTLEGALRYLLVLSRPRFWLYLAGPVLVGAAYAVESVGDFVSLPILALLGYFLVPANVFLYGINDIYDREIDASNPKKADKESRYEGQRVVPVAVTACALLPLVFVPALSSEAWPWLAAFLFLGTAYSAPPLRFKTTPLLDSVSNGLYVAPAGAAYAAVAGSQPPLLAVLGGWLWAMAMHTFSAIPDIEPDRKTGIRTTATVLGEKRTYAYCVGCWLLAAVAFGALEYRLGALMLVYPALVVAVALVGVSTDRAYWWFPAINAVVGAIMTMGGLSRVVYG